MGRKLSTVAVGAGGLVTAVTTAVLCFSLWGGRTPGQLLVGVMTAGLIVLVIGAMLHFEEQSRLWASQMETQLHNRWHGPRSPATSHQPARGSRTEDETSSVNR